MSKSGRLSRRPPTREPLPRILIVCEGCVTEKSYIQHLRTAERIPIHLQVEAGGTPKTLVETAVRLKKEAAKRAKQDPNNRFDQVWCVFDVDEHPYLLEAKQQAQANGIQLSVSIPCFELWILLHFQDQRKHLTRQSAQSTCRKFIPDYAKQLPCEQLVPFRGLAIERAEALESWQIDMGREGDNPSTQVYRLVRELLSFRR